MPSFTQRVAVYFREHPDIWIDGVVLAHIGGRYAWRSRISECRRQLGMIIENRQRTVQGIDGAYTVSEYRYRPRTDTSSVANGEITEALEACLMRGDNPRASNIP